MKYYRINRIFKKRKGSQQNSERVTKALSQHCSSVVHIRTIKNDISRGHSTPIYRQVIDQLRL